MTAVLRLDAFGAPDDLPAAASGLFAAAGVFGSLAWWRTVVAWAMPEGTRPCFLLCRRGEMPAAVFPLRQPARGGALASLTTPYSCRYAPLLAAGLDSATRSAVFAAFARYCRGWSTMRLDAVAEDWAELADCVAGARAAGLVVVRFAHFGNWHEDVRGLDWAAYLGRRPGALRETIRRKLRRADRRQGARFSVVRGGTTLEAGIAAYEAVYARSWKPAEPFPRFNAALMRALAAVGMLRLGLWQIGETPVAAQFWVVEQGRATVLKLAHDEAFQAESPGTVLTALMLRSLLDEERVGEIDFGRGDDAYKQGWAAQRRQRIGLVLVNPRRPAGLAFLARHEAGRMMAGLRRR